MAVAFYKQIGLIKIYLKVQAIQRIFFSASIIWHNFDKLENLQICLYVSGPMLKEECII